MDTEQKIKEHLSKLDLDLRKNRYSRFMDQKVTPDVLSFIAECIINLNKPQFTTTDVWESDYFEKNTRAVFGKPSPKDKTASSEYDKFIAQPMRMLVYAGILNSNKMGNTHIYTVTNPELLEFLAIRERNAFLFLSHYILKVLGDSGILSYFDDFKKKSLNRQAKQEDLKSLKTKFQKFIMGNTPINGLLEINRIFPKVLNVYANDNSIQGTVKGHITKSDFVFSDLMYNRVNFRDIGKEKGVSRIKATELKRLETQRELYLEYVVQKAMNFIDRKYRYSEVQDSDADDSGFHIHHIFPKHEFPQFRATLENLIKLTIKQHLSKAHPKGNTQIIDRDYQCVCLLAKSKNIEKSLSQGDFIYSKETFINMVNIGLNASINISSDFNLIRHEINKTYNNF